MKFFFLFIFFIYFSFSGFLKAQELPKEGEKVSKEKEDQDENPKEKEKKTPKGIEAEEEKDKKEVFVPTADDYLFSKASKAPENLTKPLSIDSYYNHNYLRKDFFGFVPFPNLGQPLNPLIYTPSFELIPQMGFLAKSFNYLNIEDIAYYDVKTPTTQFYYEGKYGMRRDPMVVDALFTHNPSKEINYSLSYQSLRGPKMFPREQALRNRLLATLSFRSPLENYKLLMHYINQSIDNQENFGMKDFRDYKNQVGSVFGEQSLEVLFDGKGDNPKASSLLKAQRFYLKHSIYLNSLFFSKKNSEAKEDLDEKLQEVNKKENLAKENLGTEKENLDEKLQEVNKKENLAKENLGTEKENLDEKLQEKSPPSNRFFLTHSAFYEPKKYSYKQSGTYDEPFGSLLEPIKPSNEKETPKQNSDERDTYERENEIIYKRLTNQLDFLWNSKESFFLNLGFAHHHIRYELASKYENPPIEIPNIKSHVWSLLGTIEYKFLNFLNFKTNLNYAFSEKFKESIIIKSNLEGSVSKDIKIGGGFSTTQLYPNLNQIAHNSFYTNFNYHNPDFKPIETKSFTAYLSWNPYFLISGNIHNIEDYIYFEKDKKPRQYKGEVKIFNLKAKGTLKFWKLGLENTLLYQDAFRGKKVLPLPSFIARSSLYYEDLLFNKSTYLQTGISLNYFSKFKSRSFFPIINEFVLSPLINGNPIQTIGGYPFFDAFINFSVFRMQFYLRVLHLNSDFSNFNYFVSPGYPAKKWDLRIGILWNLFT